MTNESTSFTRIQHRLFNGTIETLFSNDKLNADLTHRTEINLQKIGRVYIIKIEPIREHSAGVYTCEDDISLNNKNEHSTNITLHVLGID